MKQRIPSEIWRDSLGGELDFTDADWHNEDLQWLEYSPSIQKVPGSIPIFATNLKMVNNKTSFCMTATSQNAVYIKCSSDSGQCPT